MRHSSTSSRSHCFVSFSVLVAILFAVPFASQAADPEPLVFPDVEIRKDVEYGTGAGERLTLHLAMPKNDVAKRPALLFIHGGGWAKGDKDHLLLAIRQAATQGFVAVSVGYRFAPKHLFPAQIEDVKCAARWVRAHADELKVDPERLGAIGYSAGAHLSMLLGTMDSTDGLEGEGGWQDQSSKVQAVVSYFGPTNFDDVYPDASRGIVQNFLGGTLEEKKEVYLQASPITYVNAGDAPMLLYQGTRDSLVPYNQAVQMAEAMTKANVPGRVEILIGLNHGWAGQELIRTQKNALEFFAEQLKLRD